MQRNVTCPYRQLLPLIRLRTGGCSAEDPVDEGVEASTRVAHGTANRDRQTHSKDFITMNW